MGKILGVAALTLLPILPDLIKTCFFENKKRNKKMDREISRIKKDIKRIFKTGGVFLKIGIFIMIMVLVSIVANFFYIHATNTRLDKIENTQARFEIELKEIKQNQTEIKDLIKLFAKPASKH